MTIKTGLIGSPLGRSLSPGLFRVISALLGEKFSYSRKEVRPAGLAKALEEIKRSGWRGFNVTLPLKERILPFLSRTDKAAGAIGAVNAVLVRDGKLYGFNTDAGALASALREAKAGVKGRTCVIWGAGGAARSAAWTLASLGASEISLLNRSAPRAQTLARHFAKLFPRVKFKTGKFQAPVPEKATVFVNATPLGMYGPLPKTMKAPDLRNGVYCDFAYARGATPFLKARPGKTINGLDLLIYQGLAGAALWTGRRMDARKLAELKERTKRLLYA